MSTPITVVTVSIPNVDINGAFINYQPLGNALAPLAIDSRYYTSQPQSSYDDTSAFKGQATWMTVFLVTTNDTLALAAYTTWQATLAVGTITEVWYNNSTLGV